jgi:23S rRNA pseudouridine1911/1915/1917 synthase
MNHRALTLPEDTAPERLDRALARAWPDLSRSRLQAFVRDGRVTVDGATTLDPSAKVAGGAAIGLSEPPPLPAEPSAEAIALYVVHEDADLIVIDKPAGLVVHPAAGHESGTLVNALLALCGDSLSGIGGVKRPGIVHRLDKDTTGLMVVAKNDRAHAGLAAQFADHGRSGPLERAYRALVWGAPEPREGTVRTGIARSTQHRERMAAVAEGQGRIAVTRYTVEERWPDAAEPLAGLVRCELETGRTHQIRVHMAHAGHPLLGDALYGSGFKTKANRLDDDARTALEQLSRQALHAAVLGFEHPTTGRHLRFESPLPADMERLLRELRRLADDGAATPGHARQVGARAHTKTRHAR